MKENNQYLAAIDVGSNAIRIAIGKVVSRDKVEIVEASREPVRLGMDTFRNDEVSEATTEKLIATFKKVAQLLTKYQVKKYRAVATSALREAYNRAWVCDQIEKATGVFLEIITAEEEARLVNIAVSVMSTPVFGTKMLIDIGGGSVEVILSEKNHIVAIESFRLGAVRLSQMFKESAYAESVYLQLVREYASVSKRWVKNELGSRTIELVVGTGGNIEALNDLSVKLLKTPSNGYLSSDSLSKLIEIIQNHTVEDRVTVLKMRPDRADVILPAAIVLQDILSQSGCDQILVPNVGVKDGLLLDLLRTGTRRELELNHDQSIVHAYEIGRKYQFDEMHARTVARLSLDLFDTTKNLHGLSDKLKQTLEIAALLHDVGQFINPVAHHKHSQYIIQSTPLVGLTDRERLLIALVARYHRKSIPNSSHADYQSLNEIERDIVMKLAAILRIGDALDREHESRVHNVRANIQGSSILFELFGSGDLLLEKWAVVKKATLFEQCFSLKVVIPNEAVR